MKHGILFLLILLQAVSCAAQQDKPVDSKKNVVCFVYHRVGDSRYPSTNISISDFESHLRWLSSQKFVVRTLSDALEYLKSGEASGPVAVITVDDGYKSFYLNGLPLLKKYHMPATLFINTETVGGGDMMTWEQLKDATDHGVEIGNHTHSHAYFLNEVASTRYDTFKKEIQQSQDIIKEHLDIVPSLFSYPYGEFDEKMEDIVKQLGFRAAAAQRSGVMYNGTDLFQIPRFPMSESYADLDKFKEKALMKPLPVIKVIEAGTLVTPANTKPTLTVTIDASAINTTQLKCYLQGGECELELKKNEDGTVTVSARPAKSIASRRRTICTLTAPGSKSGWYWYSHLWINPKVK